MKWWVTERSPTDFPPVDSFVFLDSGAFSAHTQGIAIDIQSYCDFIKRYEDAVTVYAALDVIGNVPETNKNVEIMESQGLYPLPTFHRGSRWSELQRLCERYDYFALGGVASENAGRKILQNWLDGCFSIIGKHWPKRIHGFGIQSQWALERYPFFSTDSTNSIIGGGLGRVSQFVDGKLTTVHWTQYSRTHIDASVIDTETEGSAYMQRIFKNCEALVALEKHLTDLWTHKGVVWS